MEYLKEMRVSSHPQNIIQQKPVICLTSDCSVKTMSPDCILTLRHLAQNEQRQHIEFTTVYPNSCASLVITQHVTNCMRADAFIPVVTSTEEL